VRIVSLCPSLTELVCDLGLAEATGLERGRFRIVDGELLPWFGSRTPRGIDYAERVICELAKSAG